MSIKTKEEILKPFIETPFRHTRIVEEENALIAMGLYADQFKEAIGVNWIPTKDNPPPDYKNVMYFNSIDGNIQTGYFVWSQTPLNYITHWMELPENPTPTTNK